jgi:hypothetical protein
MIFCKIVKPLGEGNLFYGCVYNSFVLGFDFSVFWETGRALLAGQDIYAVHLSAYPPAAAYLYALFALLPFGIAFPIWSGANVLFLFDTLRRRGMAKQFAAWLGCTPVLFVLLTGQIDLFYLWVASFLPLGNGQGVAAAVLITLKPQAALVLLPWFLIRWLLREPRKLLAWGIGCLALHGLPLVFDPGVYQRWFAVLGSQAGWRAPISSGVFLLSNANIPLWVMAMLAAAAAIWGLTRDADTARAALLLAQPSGVWYMDALLAGTIDWRFFLPLSWAAFIAAQVVENSLPLIVIPLGVVAWNVWRRKRA